MPSWRPKSHALAEVLAVKDGERWPPMVDALTRARRPGNRARRGVGRGTDVRRRPRCRPALARAAAVRSGAQPARAALTPLAGLVQGPPALARVLSQIGLVDDDAFGDAPQAGSGAGPGAGVARRRGLALGRLHDPRRARRPRPRSGCSSAIGCRLLQRDLASAGEDAARRLGARCDAAGAADRRRPRRSSRRAPARTSADQRLRTGACGACSSCARRRRRSPRGSPASTHRSSTWRPSGEEADGALAQARDAQAALPDLAALRSAVEAAREALSDGPLGRCGGARRTRDAGARACRSHRAPLRHRGRARRLGAARRRCRRAAWRTWRNGAARPRPSMPPCRPRPAQIAARRAEALDRAGSSGGGASRRDRRLGAGQSALRRGRSCRARRRGVAGGGARGCGAVRRGGEPGRADLAGDAGADRRTARPQPGDARPAGGTDAGGGGEGVAGGSSAC